jgi:hypothetical protein
LWPRHGSIPSVATSVKGCPGVASWGRRRKAHDHEARERLVNDLFGGTVQIEPLAHARTEPEGEEALLGDVTQNDESIALALVLGGTAE